MNQLIDIVTYFSCRAKDALYYELKDFKEVFKDKALTGVSFEEFVQKFPQYTDQLAREISYTGMVVTNTGIRLWFKNGKLHRDDGFAEEWPNGRKYWFQNGKLHRINGPAATCFGIEEWYFEGKLHREDGPARTWTNGSQEWWVNGELHREDGPAIIYTDGSEEWYQNGKLHRLDGPAIEYANGKGQYWVHGKRTDNKLFF